MAFQFFVLSLSLSLHIMCVLGFSASFGNYGQRCVQPVLHSLPAQSVHAFMPKRKSAQLAAAEAAVATVK